MRTFIVTMRGEEAEDTDAFDVRDAVEQWVPHALGNQTLDIDVMEVNLAQSTARAKRVLKAGRSSGVHVEGVA